jgi:hypothetical protein
MATLGKAVIEFSADTAKFISDVGRTAAVFDRNMAKMVSGIESIRNAVVAAAGLGGVGALMKSAINAGDELNKLSQKVGIGVEQLSELKFAADLADVGIQDLGVGLKEFNKSLTEAQDKGSKSGGIFAALGIGDLSQDPNEALRQVADAFSKLQDGALKTTAATEFFGKSGMTWIPLLNQGRDSIDRAAQSARNLGLIIGPQLAAQSEQFNDNIKVLGLQASALGITLSGKLVEGLTTITGNLVKAAEAGNLLKGVFLELTRLAAAFMSQVPMVGGVVDTLIQKQGLFNQNGPVKGLIRGPDGKPINQGGGTGAPDQAQLSCVLSGGKWVNGQCVRASTGAGKSSDDLVGRQLAEAAEEEARIMSEAAQATDEYRKRMRQLGEAQDDVFANDEERKAFGVFLSEEEKRQHEERMKQWLELIDVQDQSEQNRMRAAAGFDEQGNKIKEDLKEQKDLARDLGLTFTSAFEDAVIHGKKFSDVLKGIQQDIARIIIRKSITEPLGGAISKGIGGIIEGIFGGKGGGGGGGAPSSFDYSFDGLPSFDVGTSYVPRDMLAMVHQGEAIIPAAQNRGGGTDVNINLTVNALDPRTATHAIMANMPAIAGVLRKAAAARGNGTPF